MLLVLVVRPFAQTGLLFNEQLLRAFTVALCTVALGTVALGTVALRTIAPRTIAPPPR